MDKYIPLWNLFGALHNVNKNFNFKKIKKTITSNAKKCTAFMNVMLENISHTCDIFDNLFSNFYFF